MGVAQAGSTVTAASNSGGVVTYTTAIAHGFFVGQTVNVTGTINSGGAAFNFLNVQVTTVPSTTTFTIAVTTALTGASTGTALIPGFLFYNDSAYDEQITRYTPPIGRLDRFHVTLRRHQPFSNITTINPVNAPIIFGSGENTFTFEIEYLDNVFDDFSTFETRLSRA
jgi:hypothetical protein